MPVNTEWFTKCGWGVFTLSWPKKPSAQGSARQPESPKGVIHPERRVFERMCIFGQHKGTGGRMLGDLLGQGDASTTRILRHQGRRFAKSCAEK
jgi:hypothetical protein